MPYQDPAAALERAFKNLGYLTKSASTFVPTRKKKLEIFGEKLKQPPAMMFCSPCNGCTALRYLNASTTLC